MIIETKYPATEGHAAAGVRHCDVLCCSVATCSILLGWHWFGHCGVTAVSLELTSVVSAKAGWWQRSPSMGLDLLGRRFRSGLGSDPQDLFQSRPGLVTAWSCRRLGVFAAIMILVSWACRPCVDSMGYIYTYTYIYIYICIYNE